MECRAPIVPSTGGNPTADDHWCGSGEMPLWKECSWQWLRYLKDIGEQFLQRQETWSSLPSYINAPQKDNGKLRVVDSQWQVEGTWGPLGSLSLQWKNKQLRNTFRTWYLKLQNSGDISILSRIGGSRTCCHLFFESTYCSWYTVGCPLYLANIYWVCYAQNMTLLTLVVLFLNSCSYSHLNT